MMNEVDSKDSAFWELAPVVLPALLRVKYACGLDSEKGSFPNMVQQVSWPRTGMFR